MRYPGTRFRIALPSAVWCHWPLLLGLLAGVLCCDRATPVRGNAAIAALFSEFDSADSPGCAVGVRGPDGWVYRDGFGLASLEHQAPITADTVFFISSMSKQFVAAAAFVAASEGHLTLDDPVRRWVPELSEAAREVRVSQLIHHTAGIPDYLMLMSLADMPFENVYRDGQILDLLARQPHLSHEPGEQYLYGNGNYWLLGLVVARASGQSLREFADRALFRPLGMRNTHFHDDRSHVVPLRAFAYDQREGPQRWVLDFHTNFERVGASGVLTTLNDLARWDDNLRSDRLPGAPVEKMLRTGTLSSGEETGYGGGLAFGSYRGAQTVAHTGAFMGFRSSQLWFPEHDLSVLALCNAGNARPFPASYRIADLLLAQRLEARGSRPSSSPAPSPSEPQREIYKPTGAELEEYAGSYYSAALDVTHHYRAEAGRLVLTLDLDPRELPSEPVGKDHFASPLYSLEFHRGPDGDIVGLTMQARRIRDQSFVKVADRLALHDAVESER